MNKSLQRIVGIVLLVLVIALAARYLLAPQPAGTGQGGPTIDQYGCSQPPQAVFTKLGIDASVASIKVKDVVVGALNVKTDPGVIDLVGKASRDATVRDYSRCLALKRDEFTNEQAAYMDRFNAFMLTSPTPDQFIQWQEKNPFPKKIVLKESAVLACSKLNVTAEWVNLDAPQRTQTCTYPAPTNCTIISSSVEKLSDSNGSSNVSVDPTGRVLTATVTARPHGSAVDRKRGWIEIDVTAMLRCEVAS